MMKSRFLSKTFHAVICALVLSAIFPVAALGQRRWVVMRPHRSRVVVYNYQPRPYVIYQTRPNYNYRSYTYGYPQASYGSQYYTNGYSQPYYTNRYYSYRYSQPYFANPYTYSYANPTYYYDGYQYRPRYRHNGVRIRVRFR
jgi:hypothetical protein